MPCIEVHNSNVLEFECIYALQIVQEGVESATETTTYCMRRGVTFIRQHSRIQTLKRYTRSSIVE